MKVLKAYRINPGKSVAKVSKMRRKKEYGNDLFLCFGFLHYAAAPLAEIPFIATLFPFQVEV
jgi:hypothetical protein